MKCLAQLSPVRSMCNVSTNCSWITDRKFRNFLRLFWKDLKALRLPLNLPAQTQHAQLFEEMHGVPGPPPLTADFCVCTSTMDGAEEFSREYMGTFVYSNFEHYELLGDHFSKVKGYDSYAAKIEVAKEVGIEGIIDGFMQAAVWGTPDRILREFEKRRAIIGDFELATSFRFGGTPYEVAEKSIKLFAKEVLPVLKSWKEPEAKQAAE